MYVDCILLLCQINAIVLYFNLSIFLNTIRVDNFIINTVVSEVIIIRFVLKLVIWHINKMQSTFIHDYLDIVEN